MNRLSTVSPQVRGLWERALKDQIQEDAVPALLPVLPSLQEKEEINILVTGKLGAGKSSLINAFCGKYLAERPEEREGDEGVALSVGVHPFIAFMLLTTNQLSLSL